MPRTLSAPLLSGKGRGGVPGGTASLCECERLSAHAVNGGKCALHLAARVLLQGQMKWQRVLVVFFRSEVWPNRQELKDDLFI